MPTHFTASWSICRLDEFKYNRQPAISLISRCFGHKPTVDAHYSNIAAFPKTHCKTVIISSYHHIIFNLQSSTIIMAMLVNLSFKISCSTALYALRCHTQLTAWLCCRKFQFHAITLNSPVMWLGAQLAHVNIRFIILCVLPYSIVK